MSILSVMLITVNLEWKSALPVSSEIFLWSRADGHSGNDQYLILASYALCPYVSFGLCVFNSCKLTTLQWYSTYKPTYCDASPIAYVATEALLFMNTPGTITL